MLYEYRVLIWQLVAYIKQSLKSAEWRKCGYMLIYDRQKWGDFSKGEEIPLLVLSLKILTAVDFPSSYFWTFSPWDQMGSLTSHQVFNPSRVECPLHRPAVRFITISCSPEIHDSFLSSTFSFLQKIWILGCKGLQPYYSVLLYT